MSFHYMFMCPQNPEIDILNWSSIVEALSSIGFIKSNQRIMFPNTDAQTSYYESGVQFYDYIEFDF